MTAVVFFSFVSIVRYPLPMHISSSSLTVNLAPAFFAMCSIEQYIARLSSSRSGILTSPMLIISHLRIAGRAIPPPSLSIAYFTFYIILWFKTGTRIFSTVVFCGNSILTVVALLEQKVIAALLALELFLLHRDHFSFFSSMSFFISFRLKFTSFSASAFTNCACLFGILKPNSILFRSSMRLSCLLLLLS